MENNKENKDLFLRSSYFYNLPEEQIAQKPLEPRDSSRLLIFNKATEQVEHKHFFNIIDYFSIEILYSITLIIL